MYCPFSCLHNSLLFSVNYRSQNLNTRGLIGPVLINCTGFQHCITVLCFPQVFKLETSYMFGIGFLVRRVLT